MADEEYDETAIADYQEDEGADELYGDEGITGGDGTDAKEDGDEPEKMKARVLEMEEELNKLTEMQQQVEKQITSASDRIDENSM
jgi:hypothetical protein